MGKKDIIQKHGLENRPENLSQVILGTNVIRKYAKWCNLKSEKVSSGDIWVKETKVYSPYETECKTIWIYLI